MAPDLQALLILAMADRGDAEAMPAMLEAAKSGPAAVRIAAIEVLKSLGDASCVPVLLSVAAEDEEEVAQAAKATLKSLPGEGVDADLVARLANAKAANVWLCSNLVGLRRIDAVPPLLKAVDDRGCQGACRCTDRAGRGCQAGQCAGIDRTRRQSAACRRWPGRPQGTASRLYSHARSRSMCRETGNGAGGSTGGAKDAILETLTAWVARKPCRQWQTAAKSDDAQLQDTATGLLGAWMTVDAGPVLLDLATGPEARIKVRALRGYIRLPRQFLMPDAQRVAMCRRLGMWPSVMPNASWCCRSSNAIRASACCGWRSRQPTIPRSRRMRTR